MQLWQPSGVSGFMKRILKYLAWGLGGIVALLALAIVLLTLFGNTWFRGPVERLASRQLEREVTIDRLAFHLLSVTPGVSLEGVRIANPTWEADKRPLMARAGRFDVAIRLWPLLKGDLVIARLGLEEADVALVRLADGKANWSFGNAKPETEATTTTPLALPIIERMYVRDSKLSLRDAVAKLNFDGGFSTEEIEAKRGEPFTLSGKGTLNTQPFSVDLTGGALRGVLENGAEVEYPFTLAVKHGATQLDAKGHFGNLMDFDSLQATLDLRGNNLADLYYITGLALPSTRAYRLQGELNRDGNLYKITNLRGKLGGSDLNGNLSIDIGGAKPLLVADLNSRSLNPEDAGVIFGGEAALEGKTPYLIPDSTLELSRLRGMDARVTYRAAAIQVDTLPLKEVSLSLHLKDGKMVISPLALTLPQGIVSSSLIIDASQDVPPITLDAQLKGTLDDFVKQAGQEGALSGPLLARVTMQGQGTSFHDAMSVADGQVGIVIPNGQVRKAFAELLGVNARGLGLLFTGSQTQIPIRCGVGSFNVKDGVLQTRHLVVDTEVTRADGEGYVNLKDESLHLTLRGTPKEARLVRLLVPIRIGGTLLSPDVGVKPLPLGVQAGTAAALSAVLTPIAAILPFVDIGLAENADCAALVADTKR